MFAGSIQSIAFEKSAEVDQSTQNPLFASIRANGGEICSIAICPISFRFATNATPTLPCNTCGIFRLVLNEKIKRTLTGFPFGERIRLSSGRCPRRCHSRLPSPGGDGTLNFHFANTAERCAWQQSFGFPCPVRPTVPFFHGAPTLALWPVVPWMEWSHDRTCRAA